MPEQGEQSAKRNQHPTVPDQGDKGLPPKPKLPASLARRIAVAHGGTAAVRTREGGGSVFQIALPTHA